MLSLTDDEKKNKKILGLLKVKKIFLKFRRYLWFKWNPLVLIGVWFSSGSLIFFYLDVVL